MADCLTLNKRIANNMNASRQCYHRYWLVDTWPSTVLYLVRDQGAVFHRLQCINKGLLPGRLLIHVCTSLLQHEIVRSSHTPTLYRRHPDGSWSGTCALSLIKHTFFYIFLLETRAHQYPGFRARTEKFKFESNLELASANKLATTNGGKWRYTHF
jgi:hypothetical protein